MISVRIFIFRRSLKTIEAEMRKIVKESLSLQVMRSQKENLSFMEIADESNKKLN